MAEAAENLVDDRRTVETSRWVSFTLGAEAYAVGVTHVREVLNMMDIAPVAGAPQFVLGIVNLRGNVVTVVDAYMKFGLSATNAGEGRKVMILESGETIVGVLVDGVSEVVDVPLEDIEPPPQVGQQTGSRYISGVVHLNEQVYILVDVDEMLSDAVVQGNG